MEFVMKMWAYVSANWYGILTAMAAFLYFAQVVTKLTPTTKDDSFVQRMANIFEKLTGFIPNVKLEKSADGKIVLGVHKEKPVKLTKTLAKKED